MDSSEKTNDICSIEGDELYEVNAFINLSRGLFAGVNYFSGIILMLLAKLMRLKKAI